METLNLKVAFNLDLILILRRYLTTMFLFHVQTNVDQHGGGISYLDKYLLKVKPIHFISA